MPICFSLPHLASSSFDPLTCQEARAYMAQALAEGLQPDMVLMNSIIAAAGRAGNLTLQRETYQEALDAGAVAEHAPFVLG